MNNVQLYKKDSQKSGDGKAAFPAPSDLVRYKYYQLCKGNVGISIRENEKFKNFEAQISISQPCFFLLPQVFDAFELKKWRTYVDFERKRI